MSNKLISAVAGIALVLSAIGLFTGDVTNPVIERTIEKVGAAAGPTFDNQIEARDSITVGGRVFATSSAGTVTYTAVSLVNTNLVEHNATGALTATLPTEASLSAAGFLPRQGDTKTIFIHASTTKITLAGNTNLTLHSASTTLEISPNTTARLDFVRLGATEARKIQAFLIAD